MKNKLGTPGFLIGPCMTSGTQKFQIDPWLSGLFITFCCSEIFVEE